MNQDYDNSPYGRWSVPRSSVPPITKNASTNVSSQVKGVQGNSKLQGNSSIQLPSTKLQEGTPNVGQMKGPQGANTWWQPQNEKKSVGNANSQGPQGEKAPGAQGPQAGGRKKYTKTDKHVTVKNRKHVVYQGQRGGSYIKSGGKYVSLRSIS